MNKILYISCLTAYLLVGTQSIVKAVPIGTETDRANYLIEAYDLHKITAGVYARTRDRQVSVMNRSQRLAVQKNLVYVGYDVKRWMSIYGIMGSSETDINRRERSSESEFGIGARFNLLSHDLMSPHLMEDQIRITGALEYTYNGADIGADKGFSEVYAALTFSLINNIEGNKLLFMDAISFFGGPCYSEILNSDIKTEESAGFNLGMEFYISPNLSLEAATETIDSSDFNVGIHIRL